MGYDLQTAESLEDVAQRGGGRYGVNALQFLFAVTWRHD
jgi:hypothetical protein